LLYQISKWSKKRVMDQRRIRIKRTRKQCLMLWKLISMSALLGALKSARKDHRNNT
ncbi:phosphatidylserine decarboxylase proenzyme, partial [Biomphalaria pfeifferi]